ncbi:MAG: SRPBCC domain-containing protein [bacterium]
MSDTLTITRDLPFPPDRVWRAIATGALMAEWLMPNDFQPVVGHRFQFRAPAVAHWNGVTDAEVLQVDPPRVLSYSWNSSGDEAATGIRTVVTFTLTANGKGTTLRMEQAGFREDQTQNLNGAAYGWQRFLAQLETVLAR